MLGLYSIAKFRPDNIKQTIFILGLFFLKIICCISSNLFCCSDSITINEQRFNRNSYCSTTWQQRRLDVAFQQV